MTHAEALEIGRKAIEAAAKTVGNDQEAIMREIVIRATHDAALFEALAVAGFLAVQSGQSVRH